MMKAALVLLTRGYPNNEWYSRLIQRNNHIYENFNKKLKTQYPLVIFHEGNITEEQQKFIVNQGKNEDVRFVNISSHFQWPQYCNPSLMKDSGFSHGYRIMCAFNSLHIWNYCKEFDYIFRIDEDTLIGDLDYDVFEYMESKNLDYMVGRFCEETHPLTNETIPPVAHALLGEKWKESDYDQTKLWVPYTNLYIAKTSLFLQPEVQNFLKALVENPDFFYNRWGDHVVSGIVLKAFSKSEKTEAIPNFIYLHGSHHCVTQNGRALEGILSSHEAEVFDCVLSGKSRDHYIARELFDDRKSY
jgi:hypothetical protein